MSEGYQNPVYHLAAMLSVAAVLAVAVVSLVYFIINASELHGVAGIVELAVCMVIVYACLALLVYDLICKLRSSIDMSDMDSRFRSSALAATGSALAIMIFLSLAIVLITTLVWEPVEADFLDDYTDIQLAALFMMAGPEEEFLCRFLLIGVPMAIVALVRNQGGAARMALGGFGATRTAWIFILISAAVFALLHLDGWSVSKIPQITVTGIILGYMFCEYGLHTTIVMHSVLDCMSILAFFDETSEALVMLGLAAAGLVLLIMVASDHRRYLPNGDEPAPECRESVFKMWTRH